MSEFFKSELVRGDIQDMADLQQFCVRSMVTFPVLPKEKKMLYFEALETLIEKQKIFYARLKLSDDPDAQEMAESMKDAAVMLGASPSDDIYHMFDEFLGRVAAMKEKLEAEEP
jgi:hypothetical protein